MHTWLYEFVYKIIDLINCGIAKEFIYTRSLFYYWLITNLGLLIKRYPVQGLIFLNCHSEKVKINGTDSIKGNSVNISINRIVEFSSDNFNQYPLETRLTQGVQGYKTSNDLIVIHVFTSPIRINKG